MHEFIGGIVVHGPDGYKIADAKVKIMFFAITDLKVNIGGF